MDMVDLMIDDGNRNTGRVQRIGVNYYLILEQ